jgi:two-component system, chemotaxis family, protein-glutamate methylesterase/glutaminase
MKHFSILSKKYFKCIVIGVSAGGMRALNKLLPVIPLEFPIPIVIVQHIHKSSTGFYIESLNSKCHITVKLAENNETLKSGFAYFAPPDNHVQITEEHKILLTKDEKVNYSRPAIDVLFNSASEIFEKNLLGIILTGANYDGTEGMEAIKQAGGFTIAQNPIDAEYPVMPKSAVDSGKIDLILTLDEISSVFINWRRT